MLPENLVASMMQSIAQGYNETYTTMFKLHSLYLIEHKRKYVVGDQVIIEEGKLINPQGKQCTHEITLLLGTLADNKHEITLRNLSTNELLKIEL